MKETNKSKKIILQVHRIKHLQSEDFVFRSFFASELVTSPFIHSSARSHGLIGGSDPPGTPRISQTGCRSVVALCPLSILWEDFAVFTLSFLSVCSKLFLHTAIQHDSRVNNHNSQGLFLDRPSPLSPRRSGL